MSINIQQTDGTELNNIQQKKNWTAPEVEVISHDSITSGLAGKGDEGLTLPFGKATPKSQYFS